MYVSIKSDFFFLKLQSERVQRQIIDHCVAARSLRIS